MSYSNVGPNTPVSSPPPGQVSNFIDPPSLETPIIALEGVFISLMLIAILTRIWTRIRIIRFWGWEDTFCVLAALGSLAHMIVYTQNVKVGLGRHLWDIKALELSEPQNTRALSANGITYPFTILMCKLSLLVLYWRLFKVQRGVKMAIWVAVAVDVAFYCAYMFITIDSLTRCIGIAQLSDGFCVFNSGIMVVITSIVNVITDWYIFCLPIIPLRKLQLQKRQKMGLVLVFASGLVVCAASLARLLNFVINARTGDILWTQGQNACFTIVEMNIAIIVACSSTFPAAYTTLRTASSSFTRSMRNLVSSRRHTSEGSGSHTAEPTAWGSGGKKRTGIKRPSVHDAYFEIREGGKDRVINTIQATPRGENSSEEDIEMTAMPDLEAGSRVNILRTCGYSVQSEPRKA